MTKIQRITSTPASTSTSNRVVPNDDKGQWLIDASRGYHPPTISKTPGQGGDYQTSEPPQRDPQPALLNIVQQQDTYTRFLIKEYFKWRDHRRAMKLAVAQNTTRTVHTEKRWDPAGMAELYGARLACAAVFFLIICGLIGMVTAHSSNGFGGPGGVSPVTVDNPNGIPPAGFKCPGRWREHGGNYSPRRDDI
jgi:hypothetical protein